MNKISGWLIRLSKGWLVVVSIIVFVLFMIFVLPGQSAKAEQYAQGSGSPDTSFYYTPEKLFELAETYGADGRQAYVRARFSFDLIFPLVYGLFLLTTISWLAGRGFDLDSRWRNLTLIPIVGVIFDLLENTSTSLVMLGFPQRRLLAAQLASIFTLLKWMFVYGSFIVLVIVFIIWIYKKLKHGS
jgi:hypothetical protein